MRTRIKLLAKAWFVFAPAYVAVKALDFLGHGIKNAGYGMIRAADQIDRRVLRPIDVEIRAHLARQKEARP